MMVDRREFLKGLSAVVTAYPGVDYFFVHPDEVVEPSEWLKIELRSEAQFQEIMLRLEPHVRKVVWPDSIMWPGSEEILPSKGTDMFSFRTHDGGETWYGAAALDMQ